MDVTIEFNYNQTQPKQLIQLLTIRNSLGCSARNTYLWHYFFLLIFTKNFIP